MAETFSQFLNRLVGLGNNTESSIKVEIPKYRFNLDKLSKLASEYDKRLKVLATDYLSTKTKEEEKEIESELKKISYQAYDDVILPILDKIKEKYGLSFSEAEKLTRTLEKNSKPLFKWSETEKKAISNALEIIGNTPKIDKLKIDFVTNSTESYYIESQKRIQIALYGGIEKLVAHEIGHHLDNHPNNIDNYSEINSTPVVKNKLFGYKELNIETDEMIREYSKRIYINSTGIYGTELISTLMEVLVDRENFNISMLVNKSGNLKKHYYMVMRILFGDNYDN